MGNSDGSVAFFICLIGMAAGVGIFIYLMWSWMTGRRK